MIDFFTVTQMIGGDGVTFPLPRYSVTVPEDKGAGPIYRIKATTIPPGESFWILINCHIKSRKLYRKGSRTAIIQGNSSSW